MQPRASTSLVGNRSARTNEQGALMRKKLRDSSSPRSFSARNRVKGAERSGSIIQRPVALQTKKNEVITNSLFNTIAKSLQSEGGTLSEAEQEKLRWCYLALISEPDWRQVFYKIGEKMTEKVALPVPSILAQARPESTVDYDIVYNNETFHIKQNAVFIGRYKECDIALKCKYASRLHCVGFFLKNHILICDVGSKVGITMLDRTKGGPLLSSLPLQRRTIILNRGETASFGLSDDVVSFNPTSRTTSRLSASLRRKGAMKKGAAKKKVKV